MSLYSHDQNGMTDICPDHSPVSPPHYPEIDGAYAVKLFLDHHPGRRRSIAMLAYQCGLSEDQLKNAFLRAFDENLELYWERVQWTSLV